MIRLPRGRQAVACLLLVLVLPGAASAAELAVAPIRLEFAPSERVQVLRLRNRGERPVLVELEGRRWVQAEGVDQFDSAPALILTPPIVELPAAGQREIRVGFRRPPAAECGPAYRVWITELPRDNVVRDARMPLRLRTRISLPLFTGHTPACQAELHWSPRDDGRLQLQNRGSGDARVVALKIRQGEQTRSIDVPGLGYLLPGSHWHLRWPPELESASNGAESAEIIVETTQGTRRGPLWMAR